MTTTKREILDYLKDSRCYPAEIARVSNMLDQYRASIVESVPCRLRSTWESGVNDDFADGWNELASEVETWKQEQKGGR